MEVSVRHCGRSVIITSTWYVKQVMACNRDLDMIPGCSDVVRVSTHRLTPPQVPFRRLHDFSPLEERRFCHLVSYNEGTNSFRHTIGAKEASMSTLSLREHFFSPV